MNSRPASRTYIPEERRNSMPNNPYMFNGSRTAPSRKGGYRCRSARKTRRNRTRKNRSRK